MERFPIISKEAGMSRRLAVLITAVSIVGGSSAYAQETNAGPGKVEVTVIPGGTMFFTDHNGTGFTNYNLGGGATYNINRFVGVEGEVSRSLGLNQNPTFGGLTTSHRTPNILPYTGN